MYLRRAAERERERERGREREREGEATSGQLRISYGAPGRSLDDQAGTTSMSDRFQTPRSSRGECPDLVRIQLLVLGFRLPRGPLHRYTP